MHVVCRSSERALVYKPDAMTRPHAIGQKERLRLCARRALLQRMAPEHKFSTAAKLCADVLGGAADGGLDLTTAAEVVGDALRLLASKHMKARPDARVCSPDSR